MGRSRGGVAAGARSARCPRRVGSRALARAGWHRNDRSQRRRFRAAPHRSRSRARCLRCRAPSRGSRSCSRRVPAVFACRKTATSPRGGARPSHRGARLVGTPPSGRGPLALDRLADPPQGALGHLRHRRHRPRAAAHREDEPGRCEREHAGQAIALRRRKRMQRTSHVAPSKRTPFADARASRLLERTARNRGRPSLSAASPRTAESARPRCRN